MKKTLYHNATIIPGPKTMEVIKDGAIVVDEKGLLLYIGTYQDLPSDHYEKSIDLKKGFVMPGLINAHGHFFNSGKPVNNFPPLLVKLVTWFARTFIGKIYLRFAYHKNYKTALNAGITTVRDVGSFYYNDIRCRALSEKGKKTYPRIVACGTMITSTGGHGYDFPDRTVVNSPWDDRKAVREHIFHQVDWIKICNTAGVSDARYVGEAGQPTMTVEEIEAACNEAHTRGYLVATHCESSEGIRRALLGGVDSIEHGAAIDEALIPLFKSNKKTLRGYTSLVPTLSTFFIPDFAHKLKPTPANEIIIKNTALVGKGCASGLKTAVKHDIALGIGNDSGVPRVTHYNLYQELINFKKHSDLTIKEIIHIATIGTAKLIHVDRLTGSLEVGKSADFIVLDHDPLDDLSNIYKPRHVIHHGYRIMRPRFRTYKNV